MSQTVPITQDQRSAECVVAIGISADGFRSLREVLGALPRGLPAAVLVVQHLSATTPSLLTELLKRHTDLTVKWAEDGEPIQVGTAYLCPPDVHLLVEHGRIRLRHSEKVQFSRPSVDVLLKSVAEAAPLRSIAVVLSGGGRDGAKGLRAVADAGGITIVEDPRTASHRWMPLSALGADHVHYVLPLEKIGPLIADLVEQPSPSSTTSGTVAPEPEPHGP